MGARNGRLSRSASKVIFPLALTANKLQTIFIESSCFNHSLAEESNFELSFQTKLKLGSLMLNNGYGFELSQLPN